MEEGGMGDLFYIILEGECQVLKATPIVIHTLLASEAMYERTQLHFKAITENYEDIHWAGMRVAKQELDCILGVKRIGGQWKMPKWPISDQKYKKFEKYVQRLEANPIYMNHDGHPFLPVNKHLVNLHAGAGFGELALMSNVERMATVKTSTSCNILATMNREEF